MTPQFSVFTPSNNAAFLPEAYHSLQAQTCGDWEWIVQPNGGITVPSEIANDVRVTVLPPSSSEWVGALKKQACAAATGPILVELDHDDLLTVDALSELRYAFADVKVGFAYSDAVHCDGEFRQAEKYGAEFGWQYREVEFAGHKLESPISFEPSPEAVSRIWYAPNHVRAFRRTAYDEAGGYADNMRVLDDQDLMSRLYTKTEFAHIKKPLYLYRIHGQNSWLKHNKEIQDNVYRLYDIYIEAMALANANRRGLRALELGGRMAAKPGFETVDLKDADICCDLNERWPFDDASIGVIRSFDVFEHLRDSVHTMKELYRVLVPGGMAFIQVPSTDGRGAFQDPTHKTFWNANSWLYYTDQQWGRYIDTPVRFQATRIFTTPMNAQHVCWTTAHLVSLKDGYRPPGIISI